MTSDHAIIGFGAVGQALAKAFARKGLGVAVATRRPPEAMAEQARAIGPMVRPGSLAEAVRDGTVLLAIPLAQHVAVAAAADDWSGRIVVDATNAFGIPLAQFGGLSASAFAARNYRGARFSKGFNHLPAAKLAADPAVGGGRRVIFVSSDDAAGLEPVKALVARLGYAPVSLGTLAESAPLVSAREDHWSPLTFQDLILPLRLSFSGFPRTSQSPAASPSGSCGWPSVAGSGRAA